MLYKSAQDAVEMVDKLYPNGLLTEFKEIHEYAIETGAVKTLIREVWQSAQEAKVEEIRKNIVGRLMKNYIEKMDAHPDLETDRMAWNAALETLLTQLK